MKTKLSVTILITVIALITGCDSIWQVNETSDITFTIDTSAFQNVKNISNGVRSIESDDLSKITISLHDATDDFEIDRKTKTFDDDGKAEIEFTNLVLVGKTVYAKALLKRDGVVIEGISKSMKMVEGSNILEIIFNEDEADDDGDDDNDSDDGNDGNDDVPPVLGTVKTPTISMVSTEATPTDSPIGNKLVTLTSETSDAQIYYTLDGTDPETNAIPYNGTPFNLLLGSEEVQLQVIAKKDGHETSNVTSETYEKLLKFTFDASSDSYSVGSSDYFYEGDIIIPATHDGVNGVRPVTSILNNMWDNFARNKMKSVVISSGLNTIGSTAFAACENLESVSIPASVETIGEGAFTINPKLTGFVLESNEHFSKIYDNKYIAEGLVHKNTGTFIASAGGHPIVDEHFNVSTPATHIGMHAFRGNSKLEVIGILDNIKTVGYAAFLDCPKLREFSIIGQHDHFKVVDDVLYIEDGSELVHYPQAKPSETYIVPPTVTAMRDHSLTENQLLKSVIIPSTVTSFSNAFSVPSVYVSKLTSKATVCALHNSINSFDVSSAEVPVVWGCSLSTDNTYLVSVTDVKIEGNSSLELQAPYRTGYTFAGWSTNQYANVPDSGFETADSLRSVNNSSGTYYAVWTQ